MVKKISFRDQVFHFQQWSYFDLHICYWLITKEGIITLWVLWSILVKFKRGHNNVYIYNGLFMVSLVFNATFNNISFISWRSVLLVEETLVHGENHQPVASHWQTWSHNVVSSIPRNELCSNSQF